MISAIVLALAMQDVSALQEEVQALHSKDLHDAARQAIETFTGAHPALANDGRLKDLVRKAGDLAREADQQFRKHLAEAEAHLDQGRPAQAMQSAAKARGFYPERKGRVEEFVRRVQERQSATAMVKVESTPCWIGCEQPGDENPRRQVRLPAFLIDRFPVTNEEYAAFAAAAGAAAPASFKGRERHPVVLVSWADAAAYAAWAGKRLPTAEEWEVAARGADQRAFPWGKVFQEKEDRFPANCVEYWQVHKTQSPGTTPVDLFSREGFVSASGAAMGGNVWEWTSTSAPGKVGDRPVEFRVLKGGSFMTYARSMRCEVWFPENPAFPHPDVGFRCAKDAK